MFLAGDNASAIIGPGTYMNLALVRKYEVQIRIGCLVFVALLLIFFSRSPPPTQLERVISDGVIQAGVRLGPLTYYEREGIPNGLDYNILEAFALDLGVNIEFEIFNELTDQLEALNREKPIDIAAATLSVTDERLKRYQFSRPYMGVDTVLIQHDKHDRPKNMQEILDSERSIVAISGSGHTELLRSMQTELPELSWQEEADSIMFQFMERAQNEEIDLAVIDSSIFDLEGSLFPRVEVALTLKHDNPIGFAFAQNDDNSLLDALDSFLDRYEESGALDELLSTYLDPEPSIDFAGSLLFNRRIEERLPEYEDLFRSTAKKYDYNWVLLAAQAYQESHWNAKAISPTGVRGLMMLTLPTANQLGVNRLDAVESLEGGMRYFISLRERLPERIVEPDRTKLALAAYNVGYGHLEDARILTERGGGNPDTWTDVEQYLPLLRQRQYFSTVAHGFARGTEPVHYVNTIYRYANILEWYAWQKDIELESLIIEVAEADEVEQEEIEDNLLDDSSCTAVSAPC